jgi:glucose/arabinose dehydrogenase
MGGLSDAARSGPSDAEPSAWPPQAAAEPAPGGAPFLAAPEPAAAGAAAAAAPAAAMALTAERVAQGLAAPIYVAAIPGDPRVFIVERAGRVRIAVDGALRPVPFLDISGRVGSAGEGGLLSIAFDPDHSLNGLFYALYTDGAGDTVLSRLRVGSDPNVADPSFAEELLFVPQPAANHNGGTLAFSPVDGHLYVGLGDGGGSNDPDERAQDGGDLLGKMLRLDVSGGAGTPYAIPPDNPFVGVAGVLDEIWALGLRNPFRFAFDWDTGDLWIGDVGQSAREEVDFEPAGAGGRNYGWDVREGANDSMAGDVAQPPYVNAPPFTDPVYDYPHQLGRCSITGGSLYRGPLLAEDGLYFFGDWCTGEIWSLDPGTMMVMDRTAELAPAAGVPRQLVAISEGGFGELYAVLLSANGRVYRLGPGGMECADGADNDGDGAVDGADPGCIDPADPSELDTGVPCDDGHDNDRDGDIDFPADTDCPDATSAAEGASPMGGGGGGGGSCGLGAELVLLLPALRGLRRRRR